MIGHFIRAESVVAYQERGRRRTDGNAVLTERIEKMSTQYQNEQWSETEPLPQALETLADACESGLAKRFIVGTQGEVEEEKNNVDVEQDVADLKRRIRILEARADQSILCIPTEKEIKDFRI